ncbi:MAG: GNAT family N-acetyltransferase [Clostridia bacterium]|nr:GNAT family N-acetyltransferase [Clostridia bacterium]
MIAGRWFQPGQPPGQSIEDALLVRRAVFVEEQGFPADTEPDALDPLSWQVVLYGDGVPMATGRIYWAEGDFHLGRICVLRDSRGRGAGDLLMRMLIAKGLDHAASSLVLGAQVQAAAFYARYGFEVEGEPYDEDGVPHYRMRADAEALRGLFGRCEGCKEDCKRK